MYKVLSLHTHKHTAGGGARLTWAIWHTHTVNVFRVVTQWRALSAVARTTSRHSPITRRHRRDARPNDAPTRLAYKNLIANTYRTIINTKYYTTTEASCSTMRNYILHLKPPLKTHLVQTLHLGETDNWTQEVKLTDNFKENQLGVFLLNE